MRLEWDRWLSLRMEQLGAVFVELIHRQTVLQKNLREQLILFCLLQVTEIDLVMLDVRRPLAEVDLVEAECFS